MTLKEWIGKTRESLADVPLIGPLVKPRPKVAVLRLTGVIADSPMRRQNISHAKFEKAIERAFEIYKLKALALLINSPGGAPGQSALIASHIRRLAEEKNVPVYAFVEDVAASGGYWLACAADEIYAQDVSILGSIGVISASFGFQELIARYGIERRVHAEGKDKPFLDPFVEEKPADIKRLKAIQKDIHKAFINWVKARRGEKLNGPDKDLFEGQFWTGEAALENGMIDGIENLRHFAREKYGERVKLVDFSPDRSWLSSLLGSEMRRPALGEDLAAALEERAARARYGL